MQFAGARVAVTPGAPETGPRRRWVASAAWPALALGLFALAGAFLFETLRAYRLHDILGAVRAIPGGRLAAALAATALNYLVLTAYDALALRYCAIRLPYRRVALASFVSYAVAINTGGLALITGSGVRYRFYAGWGLSARVVARVVVFCSVTFWLGFLALAGVLFTVAPLPLPAALHLPLATTRPLGPLLFAAAGAYLLANVLRRRPLRVRDWEFALPGGALAARQLAVSLADWTLAAGILFLLLPGAAQPGFAHVLACYLLAQIVGLASNVPGGLGVFESVLLLLLSPAVPPPALLGALVVYRCVYYLLPLACAGALLAVRQLLAGRAGVRRTARAVGRALAAIAPEAFALLVFAGGAVLLFSGALPAKGARLYWLGQVLPLPVLEFSHLLGSLAGAGLLLLARGLQRRLDAAWLLTTLLLAAGIAASLLKGLDYEEALLLSLLLALLLPARPRFYRKTSLLAEPFAAGWVVAVAAVLLTSVWLALFAYRHVEYSGSLWWQFALAGHAPRSLRALLGASVGLLMVAAAHLLQPLRFHPGPPAPEDLERAEAVARASVRTQGYLALLGDKALLFSRSRESFLMFGVQGRSWIAMGDPVGPEREAPELLWELRGLCDRYGGRTVFYEVGRDYLPLYVDLGLSPLKIGEEARVPLASFSLEGGARKGLRHAHHRLAAAGCRFEVVPPAAVPGLLQQLRGVSDAWLAERRTREKRFSLGSFQEGYLVRLPLALVRRGDEILAFANVWPGGAKVELSVDLMRHLPGAPAGVMDYLFTELLLWGRAEGYRWFNFGMAPLAGLEHRELASLWNKVGSFIYAHADPLYHFAGLRAYKEKFGPVWEPRYIAVPGGFSVPRVLPDVAILIAGGARGVLVK
jgi:phosphatidylglycerol lysyltransferase